MAKGCFVSRQLFVQHVQVQRHGQPAVSQHSQLQAHAHRDVTLFREFYGAESNIERPQLRWLQAPRPAAAAGSADVL